ncbi:MAG: AAA family ATPase, partial [Candidatus Latescibacteria bacterium]|nr:AAA family ATPase [bacterium]MBD3424199.1 AAA family ATPase [Candidatus Latescibacterota bacterium]
SIGRARGTGLGGGHDEREQTLNQILAEMDGFVPKEAVVVLAATNRPDVLDPALVRPGRFDRRIVLHLPRKQARIKILEIHSREVPLADGVDLESIAAMTVGFSGADLENLVNEAALLAGRDENDQVGMEDFNRARDKILLGPKTDDIINDEEKEVIAYHEAGHAVVAQKLPLTDPLQKVSIIPRGRSLGSTQQVPEKDRHNLKKEFLKQKIAVMLGGRASERMVFDDISNGAANDLKESTRLARRMVCLWGMSDKLGPVYFQEGEEHTFLGKEMTRQKRYSEETARIIDEEIAGLIREMENKASGILKENHRKLDKLASKLMEQETLDRDELEEILGGKDKE